jgi:hypothetical protein
MSRSVMVLGVCGLMVVCSSCTHAGSGAVAPPGTTGGTPAAAQPFLDAWLHSLGSSWSVQATFERTTRDGRRIAFPQRMAVRPPDHLTTGLGTVDARFGDRHVVCDLGSGTNLHCRQEGITLPYAKVISDQIATLATYVNGPTAIYAVAQLGGCFELRLRLASFPAPPYGRTAVFCFDPSTGAPAGSVIARDEGTDRTVVVESHSPATDADLTLPTSQELAAIARLAPGAAAHPPSSAPASSEPSGPPTSKPAG